MTASAHGDPGTATVGTYVGSPLYGIQGDHLGGLVLGVVAVPVAVLLVRRVRRGAWAPSALRAMVSGYDAVTVERRVAVWALLVSACAHLGLLPGHGWSPISVAFALDTVLLFVAARRILLQRRRSALLASVVLLGSVAGLMISAANRETPDQVAMVCKLVEVVGLLALWSPSRGAGLRRVLGTVGVCVVAVLLSVSVWGSALRSGAGHHLGAVPALGVLLPAGEDRDPTIPEQQAADRLYAQTRAAIAKYADPAVAAADGYRTQGIRGLSFHADNPAWTGDGRVLDPQRPETLVYAATPHGPRLLGAMFQMPWNQPGPAVGGPLTVWHAHEQVCLSLLPPTIAGLTSPYGLCPAGTLTVARTNEMLHVWTVDGAPERFGDLPDDWIRTHVATA